MNEHEIDRLASAFHVLRPDWPHASLRTFIANKLADRPRRDVAVALAWVACESNTATPARVLEAGPWWKAAAIEGATRPEPYDRDSHCGICNELERICRANQHNGHDFVSRVTTIRAAVKAPGREDDA